MSAPRPPVRRASRATSTTPAAISGLSARRLALDWVEAALARRGGLEAELSGGGGGDLEPRDRAFARALAATVLRRLGGLDRLLDVRLTRTPPPAVKALLRLGLAQMAVLHTPAFAAVSTTLALAERDADTRPFRGLINAVLRGLDRDDAGAALDALGPEVDVPDWLLARWRAAYGEAVALRIAATVRDEPATDLTSRDEGEALDLAQRLDGRALPTGSVRVMRRGELTEWPDYAAGRWWVQDAAAAIPARTLAIRSGETALDLCAAPGGKTLQLAAAGARVTALDRAAPRMERLKQNLARIGLDAECVVVDAAAWDDFRCFDAVLLDAPCSATGVFRRRPDVLWAARAQDVAALVEVQARLLDVAAARTAVGGRLVYCVCSLEPEEGEAQARGFAARHADFSRTALDPLAFGLPAEAGIDDGLRLLPSLWEQEGGMDGFFIARFDRLA